MPIAQLSDETTRFLRSTIALNDASIVIKELIDNALDSNATIISIEISSNALDVLQVKDNGTGIEIEDRQLLCKRGCTSKIRTLHDLENLGGQYLGFRGEALSSIADISEHMSITTRIKDEVVGTTMRFGAKGKLLSSASASHQIGTTIRVQSFLSNVPVRKQTAIKECNKVLANIKKLLLAYAFVRPKVRFSLKVLKRENDKTNWSFAPDEGLNQLSITATKIVGKEVAEQCETHATSITTMNGDRYSVDALLIAPGASEPKAGSPSQFFAIDCRPVNAERGLIKQISKMYKSCVHGTARKDLRVPTKPFLVLQITCPQGSYDVNIEPAKDEVLFHNPEIVLELAQRLFSEVYGEASITSRSSPPPQQASPSLKMAPGPAFNLLLARRKPDVEDVMGRAGMQRGRPTESPALEHSDEADEAVENSISMHQGNLSMAQQPLSNMYDIDDDDYENDAAGRTPAADAAIQNGKEAAEYDALTSLGAHIRNPFTTAALHARIRPKNMTADIQAVEENLSAGTPDPIPDDVRFSPARIALRPSTDLQYLPTPSKSPERGLPYQNPGPPVPRRIRRGSSDEEEDEPLENHPTMSSIRPRQRLLQNWIQSSPVYHGLVGASVPSLAFRSDDAVSGHDVPEFNDDRGIPDTVVSTQQARGLLAQQPFKLPLKRSARNDGVDSRGKGLPLNSELSETSELDEIMDFEHRKKAVNQRLRMTQPKLNPADLALLQRQSMTNERSTGISLPRKSNTHTSDCATDHSSQPLFRNYSPQKVSQSSSPHRNRYQAAIRNLESRDKSNILRAQTGDTTSTDKRSQLQSALSTATHAWPRSMSDPPLPETQVSPSQHPLHLKKASQRRKTKQSRPPLESIPLEAMKHNLVCIPREPFPSSATLSKNFQTLRKHDIYIQTGRIETVTWSPFSQHTQTWQANLESLISKTFRAPRFTSGCRSDVESQPISSHVADADEHPATLPAPVMPNVNINLAQAIKNHLHMLTEESESQLERT